MELFTIKEVRNMTPSSIVDLLNMQKATIYQLADRLDEINKLSNTGDY